MKSNGESLLATKSFKVQIIKPIFLELSEKIVDYSKPISKGEKRIAIETGNMLYFMKCSLMECVAGFGAKRFLQGQFEITKEQFDTKFFQKGDKLEIFENTTYDVDNFTMKDFRASSLALVEKKYHKQLVNEKTGKSQAYTENAICNIKLKCKLNQYKLHSKKTNAYYYLIENYRFDITESELTERTFTFYIDESVYQALLPLHLKKNVRVELWSLVKRIKIHEGRVECGVYEGQPFINLILTTKTAEAKQAEKLAKQQEIEANKKQKILKVGK